MQDYYSVMIEGYSKPFGHLHKSILPALALPVTNWTVDNTRRLLTMVRAGSFEDRTRVLRNVLLRAAESGEPATPRKFDDEALRVVSSEGEHVLDTDRSGLDPFGFQSFSAHLIGFVRVGDGSVRYWVPRRSASKPTLPNKLDRTVAGVIRSGERPIDCMARKIAVEASVPEDYTRANIMAAGTVSYHMSITSTGGPGCQPITSYLYEMEFGRDMDPRPAMDEVDSFTLMTLDDVKVALMEGEFVSNRAMVWLAYLVRHGVLTPENEPNFLEICQRLRREHDFLVVEDEAAQGPVG